ncbi:MAG TPA: hypothetical protein VE777_01805 [Gaiellales bacterium]|nr:hypothetical protein [Gaiellales bacterium]
MKRAVLAFTACPSWSPTGPSEHAAGRDDRPSATILIGGHLH